MRANEEYLNFIPSFASTREHPCRADLGRVKPRKYPAAYSVDEKFPVVDIDTNVTHTQ